MLGVTADAVSAALAVLGGIAERDVPLASFTTYRVGGPAAVLVRPRSVEDLGRVAEASVASGLPILTVGRGSNMLVADAGYPGLAVLSLDLDHEVRIDSSAAVVDAGAGALLPVIARQTVRAGLSGFEWAVGVPGSLGGAVRMNAGGHGSDIAASLIDVRVVDLSASGADPVVREAAALDLGFRSSNLESTDFVTSARLRLAPGDDGEPTRSDADRAEEPGGGVDATASDPAPGDSDTRDDPDDVDDVTPRGREGGMIGEPTVARRTIRVVDDLDAEPDHPDGRSEPTADPSSVDPSPDDRTTIKIGASEEDLPDALYLDEELARDDSEGTVFIEDEGIDDAVAPKDATRPGIEPRLRQRRIGVRRAASRKRLWWALGAVAVVLIVVGGLAVLGSPLFSIEKVDVTGAVYTDPEILDQVVSDLEGSPVLTADTGAAEDRLEESPWVESVRVRTDFPDAATIEIRERTPLLTMRGTDGLFRVLDREGRVLASIEGQPVAMVHVSGPGTLDVAPGQFAPIGYASAASLVTKFTPTIRTRVDHMLVTADGSDLRLILNNDPNPPIEVEFGSALGENEQVEKLVRLERVLEDVGNDGVTVINVSTSDVTVL